MSNDQFSEEYIQSQDETKEIFSVGNGDNIEIDIQKYGMSKPRRTITRANIIHDKSKKG